MHILKKSVVVYKAARSGHKRVIVTLLLPNGIKINHAIGSYKKNRADRAIVLDIREKIDYSEIRKKKSYVTGPQLKAARSISEYNPKVTYRIHKEVTPRLPFETSSEECASGIHFFRSIRNAYNWQ